MEPVTARGAGRTLDTGARLWRIVKRIEGGSKNLIPSDVGCDGGNVDRAEGL